MSVGTLLFLPQAARQKAAELEVFHNHSLHSKGKSNTFESLHILVCIL